MKQKEMKAGEEWEEKEEKELKVEDKEKEGREKETKKKEEKEKEREREKEEKVSRNSRGSVRGLYSHIRRVLSPADWPWFTWARSQSHCPGSRLKVGTWGALESGC